MATDNECVEYARDCVRLAGLATDPELRERLLQQARDWMAVAMDEDEVASQEPAKALATTS
jgi:hypothetical protein